MTSETDDKSGVLSSLRNGLHCMELCRLCKHELFRAVFPTCFFGKTKQTDWKVNGKTTIRFEDNTWLVPSVVWLCVLAETLSVTPGLWESL